ncbi:5'(3')-deoxyribonucleotidase [Rapidithrix thailandica]|uniref:5'(3')-deoxyribonucleotidase n=1 Tax=Rapidithrix thailandica TaxID=413964 RepID=A0AAW9SEK2_9BACT
MKKSIAIDMDNVIVDIEGHYIHWYEKSFGIRLDKSALIGKPEGSAFPKPEAIREFLCTPGFFKEAPTMPGAVEAVRQLAEDFEVFIVSAAMEFPQSLSEKYEWLQEHLPFISWKSIVFCGSKQVIDTDFMIDDHVKNLKHFKNQGLLFTACHNVSITGYTRVNNWEEATEYLYAAVQ